MFFSAKKNTYPINENKVQSSRMKSRDFCYAENESIELHLHENSIHIFFHPNKKCLRTLETKQILHLLYNGITRQILEQLVNADCQITISTKSTLILRDIELLKKMSNLKVAFSINTLDDTFRADMDKGSSIIFLNKLFHIFLLSLDSVY